MRIPVPLSIVSVSPRVAWDTNVSTQPTITVRFNQAIQSSLLSSDSGIATYVNLVRIDNDSTHLPVQYLGYDAETYSLTFQPSGMLTAGAVYQVTVRKEVQTTAGREMLSDRVWTFQVSSASISQVQLNSPGDSTAHLTVPALSWTGPSGTAVTGTVTYDVELHTDWLFTSPVTWSTTVTASGSGGTHSATVSSTLSGDTAYYWRVRARTSSVTGDWSETRAIWMGSAASTAPVTRQLYDADVNFRTVTVLPPEGSYHLRAWPTIRATFTQAVDSDTITTGTFQLWEAPVDGQLTSGSNFQVSGSFVVDDETVDFTPSGTIGYNKRYTLVLTTSIASTGGEYLEGELNSYFTGEYRPLYGGVIAVRAHLGGFIDDISDDEIAFALWRGSLEVNQLMYSRSYNTLRSISLYDMVNYQPSIGTTLGMIQYAELTAAINLLNVFYLDVAKEAGRQIMLGPWQVDRDVEILPELRAKMKEMKEQRARIAANYLMDIPVPRVGLPGQYFNPNAAYARDYSYRDRPSIRGIRTRNY